MEGLHSQSITLTQLGLCSTLFWYITAHEDVRPAYPRRAHLEAHSIAHEALVKNLEGT